MQFIDYYDVMGLKPEAGDDEVKRIYRKLARKFHPDVSKESDAEAKFKAVGEAYAVLKDKTKRAEYDLLRQQAQSGEGGFRPPPGASGSAGTSTGGGQQWQGDSGADYSDFFREAFGEHAAASARSGGGFGGGQRQSSAGAAGFSMRGEDVDATLGISLQAAFDGATLPLSLRLAGWGDDGSPVVTDKTLEVRVPKGVTSGQRIRLRGQGRPGLGQGEPGDLYIRLDIAEDKQFQLDGRHVTLVLPVAPWEAALGAELAVPTLAGKVKLHIPEGSHSGRKLRLKGRGLPGQPAGDQFVVLRIDSPMADTDPQKQMYRDMQQLWPDYDPRAAMEAD